MICGPLGVLIHPSKITNRRIFHYRTIKHCQPSQDRFSNPSSFRKLYDFSLSICHRLMSHPVITSTLGSAPLVQQLRQELSRKRRRTHVTEMRNRLLGCNRLRHNGNAAGRSVSWICGGELAATGDLELAALC